MAREAPSTSSLVFRCRRFVVSVAAKAVWSGSVPRGLWNLKQIMEHPDERGKKCPSLMEECFAVLQEKDGELPPTYPNIQHRKARTDITPRTQTALDIEGIFRQSASTVELEKLKALYSRL